jgi:hypothetical protein
MPQQLTSCSARGFSFAYRVKLILNLFLEEYVSSECLGVLAAGTSLHILAQYINMCSNAQRIILWGLI